MSTEERKDHSGNQTQASLRGGDILAGLRMGKVRWQEQERVGAQGGLLAEGGMHGQGQEPRFTEE